mmetsp:Transcript_26991/g.59018  ORF Transcript_26991/g.59018 Transcript_26991/m.59018 type:complete len:241 (+) Transcript_26991:24-746(+)
MAQMTSFDLRTARMRPWSSFSTKLPNATRYNARLGRMGPMASATVAPHAVSSIKEQLKEQLTGLDRGIFGMASAKKASIAALIQQLEAQNPVAAPIDNLQLLAGDWNLLYSTITITGTKRTKLGLREFIKLGNFVQSIDVENNLAVNRVEFSVSGLGMIQGSLTIRATYRQTSPSRVDIEFKDASLVPSQLEQLFKQNYDLLLSIFNPQGYLDVTYLDDTHRVGRDDKGNVFYLQRSSSS